MQNLNFCYEIEMIDIGKLNLNSFIWFLFDNEVLNGAGESSPVLRNPYELNPILIGIVELS